MREIPLANGKGVALVDDGDFDMLMQYRWRVLVGSHARYAIAKVSRRTVYMHRLLLGVSPGTLVDHEDHDGLNNQRKNIRACTRSQNCHNARKLATASSRYRGVSVQAKTGRWMARTHDDGERVHIGTFTTEAEAARAYDAYAIANYGRFANPNFALGTSNDQAEAA